MREFFLQVGDAIREGVEGVGQKSSDELKKTQEFGDIPGYKEDKQTVIDETEVNQAFEPANNVFDSLREAGDWLFDFISDFFSQIFGNLS